ncbi:NADPH-dependent FMN reductase [Clostridium sp. ASBs410]|nr:NADPH-dependent FMN reductase [Clostridium sp. ASBs410]
MSKKIVVFNGSPRKNGNTELLVDSFIEGANDSGNIVTKFNVGRMKINGCSDCKYCFSHVGECVQKDEMQEIYHALYNADMLVLASPVYWHGMTAQLKSTLDRMYVSSLKAMPITDAALLVVYGDTDTAAVDPTISHYKAITKYMGWQDRGIVSQSEVMKRGEIKGHSSLAAARNLGKSIQ